MNMLAAGIETTTSYIAVQCTVIIFTTTTKIDYKQKNSRKTKNENKMLGETRSIS